MLRVLAGLFLNGSLHLIFHLGQSLINPLTLMSPKGVIIGHTYFRKCVKCLRMVKFRL